MELIAEPAFWALAIPAVALAGISKGGLGGGGAGSIATPLIALAIPPPVAAAIMLPLLCIMDLAGIKAYFGRWDRHLMRLLVAAGVIGCLAGAAAFRHLNDNWIRVLIGAIAVGYVAYSLHPRKTLMRKPSDRAGWFWGALAGFCSFTTHAGSPPLLVYLLPQRLDKVTFAATTLMFFAAMNYVKILPYVWLGLFDLRNITTSAALVPVGIAGIYFGIWLQKRIDARWFYRVIHLLLLITGLKLLYDGITGLS